MDMRRLIFVTAFILVNTLAILFIVKGVNITSIRDGVYFLILLMVSVINMNVRRAQLNIQYLRGLNFLSKEFWVYYKRLFTDK